jgi:hypothetical protein
MVAGRAVPAGRNPSSALFTPAVLEARNAARSKTRFAREPEPWIVADMRGCFRKWRFPAQADSEVLYCNQAGNGYS